MFRLAWHNLRSQGLHGALAILGAALVVGGLVSAASVVYVVDRNLRAAVNASGAVMAVQLVGGEPQDGRIRLPADLRPFPARLVHELERQVNVVEAFEVLEAWVYEEGSLEGQEPLIIAGLDPAHGGAELAQPGGSVSRGPVRAPIVQGRYLSPTALHEAVVTQAYARRHGLSVGGTLKLAPGCSCRIVGLLDAAQVERMAGVQAVIPLGTAQELLGRGAVVDSLLLSLERLGDAEEVGAHVRSVLGPEAHVSVDSTLDASTLALASGIRHSLRAVAFFVWGFALLALIAGGIRAVLQESAQLQTLRICGWGPCALGAFYGGRSLLTGLLAGVLGCTLGGIGAWAFGQYVGLSLPSALSPGSFGNAAAPPLWVPIPATPPALVVAVALTSAAGMVPLGSLIGVCELVRRRFTQTSSS
jgi:hypothetical protein